MKMQTEVIKMNIHLGEKGQMAKEVQSVFFAKLIILRENLTTPEFPGK